MANSEGIELDGTYTGKAMAAIINQFKDHGKRNEVTLFWNTYNARDFLGTIKEIDYHQLPQPFHCYFEEDVQPLDRHHFDTCYEEQHLIDMNLSTSLKIDRKSLTRIRAT